MSETRAQRIRRLFDEALEREPSERRAFVESACADDPALASEVLSLIASHASSDGFLEQGLPAGAVAQATADITADALIGKTLGRYRITAMLGRGGMGVVYRAVQENPQRDVALKLLPPQLMNAQLLRRFELEAQALGRLQHPCIAQIFEAGTGEFDGRSQPFFAIEYVDGLPLDQYAKRHELPIRQRIDLIRKICDAIQHAHNKGVVHRDLKPGNVLVGEDGIPKVLDFGVARLTDEDVAATSVTAHGELIGTLAYMSPEQVGGRPDAIDTRSDVYSLGVMLYELLCGERPHEIKGLSITEAIRVVSEARAKPLPAAREFPPDLRTIVAKALDTDRERRYGSPAALAEDLERFRNGLPIAARAPSAAYQLRKIIGRNRVASGIAAALVLTVIGAVIGLFVQNQRVAQERDRANEEAATAREVSDFLQSLFAQADPDRAQGEEVTARELLDKGAERIEAELSGRPAVQRRLMGTMGQVYSQLGYPEQAISLLEAAVERDDADSPRRERALLLRNLAWAYREQGDLETATATAERALELASKTSDEPDNELAIALTQIGIFMRDRGNHPKADQALTRSVEIREEILGPDHVDVAASLYHLGWLRHRQGRNEEAIAIYERACPIFVREYGEKNLQTAWCLSDMSNVLIAMKKPDEAKPYLERALDIRRSMLDEGHPDLIASVQALGGLHFAAGRYAEAKAIWTEMLAMNRARFGEDHIRVARSIGNIALCEERMEALDEAERLMRESLAMRGRLYGALSLSVAEGRYNLATFFSRRGDRVTAEREGRLALKLLRDLPDTKSQSASVIFFLATTISQDTARFGEARKLFEEYLQIREQEEPIDAAAVGRAKTLLGKLLILQRRVDEGCAQLEAALPLVEQARGKSHAHTAEALFWSATCSDLRGEKTRAAELYGHAERAWSEVNGVDSTGVLATRASRNASSGDRRRLLDTLDQLIEAGVSNPLYGRYPHFERFRDDPEVAARLRKIGAGTDSREKRQRS